MKPPASLNSAASVWLFLGVFVVLDAILLWPEGLTGWRFVAVVAGALVGAFAATRQGRLRQSLWLVSGFLIGGANVVTVLHPPFDVRRGFGVALLAALLIFSIVQESPPQAGGRTQRTVRLRRSRVDQT